MSNVITMDLAQAERTIDALRQQHGELDQALSALATNVEETRAAWQGESQARFGVAWEEWLRGVREVLATMTPLTDGIQREKDQIEQAGAAGTYR